MKQLNTTLETARAIVAAGAAPCETAIYDEPVVDPAWYPQVDVRLCLLVSPWRQNDAGAWVGRACFIVDETNRADRSFLFDVYAPTSGAAPEGEANMWRFFAIWRGRWESLQQPNEKLPYVGGNAIRVRPYDVELGGYPIDNAGVSAARIPGDAYVDSGTLYFNNSCFQWLSSTLDIVNKRELYIKSHYESVVTDFVDGKAVKKSVRVLG